MSFSNLHDAGPLPIVRSPAEEFAKFASRVEFGSALVGVAASFFEGFTLHNVSLAGLAAITGGYFALRAGANAGKATDAHLFLGRNALDRILWPTATIFTKKQAIGK